LNFSNGTSIVSPLSKSACDQNEGVLICAAQSGSSAAFAKLQDRYSSRIYKTILGITKNKEDAEDALQESFLRAYVGLKRFEGRANFYTWLTRIAINSSLMILRKKRTHVEISFECVSEADGQCIPLEVRDMMPNPEEFYESRQRHLRLLRSIRKLTPPLRKVVESRMSKECSMSEIARELEISEAAVKSRLSRARKRLASSPTLGALRQNGIPSVFSVHGAERSDGKTYGHDKSVKTYVERATSALPGNGC
jgi:RNA polymerase sigma-70 factor (ECF subfamily)